MQPGPFRLVYRAFDRIEFDPRKNDEVFALRGFDLGYASRLFPGYVLEREDVRRGYGKRRSKVIGELLGDVLVLIYTRRDETCRIVTAWVADPADRRLRHDR